MGPGIGCPPNSPSSHSLPRDMKLSIEYVAGLFDGEGMVRAQKAKRSEIHTTYQVITMVGMTHRPIIEMLCSQFGGRITINDHSKRKATRRPQHCWNLSSQQACSFLRTIRPFCVVKAEEIDLALKLQASIDEHRYKLGNQYWMHPMRNQIFAEREQLFQELKRLKRPHILT